MSLKDLKVGAQVEAGTFQGECAFVGETDFAPGLWVGLMLDKPIGKNDGSVNGVRYFNCLMNHGVFVRYKAINQINGKSIEEAIESSRIKSPSRSSTPLDRSISNAGGLETRSRDAKSRQVLDHKPLNSVRSSSVLERNTIRGNFDTKTDLMQNFLSATPVHFLHGSSSRLSLRPKLQAKKLIAENLKTPSPSFDRKSFLPEYNDTDHSFISQVELERTKAQLLQKDKQLQENSNLLEKIASNEIQQKDLENQFSLANDKIEQLEKSKALWDKARYALKSRIESLCKEKEELLKKYRNLRLELFDIQRSNNEKDMEIEQFAIEAEIAQEQLAISNLDLQKARTELEALETKVNKLKSLDNDIGDYKVDKEDYESIKLQNKNLKIALAKLYAQSKREKEQLEDTLSRAQNEILRLMNIEDSFEDAQFKFDEAELKLIEVRKKLEAATFSESLVNELTDRNFHLAEQVNELRHQIQLYESLEEIYNEEEVVRAEIEKTLNDSLCEFKMKNQEKDSIIKNLKTAQEQSKVLQSRLEGVIDHLTIRTRKLEVMNESSRKELKLAYMDTHVDELKTQIINLEKNAWQIYLKMQLEKRALQCYKISDQVYSTFFASNSSNESISSEFSTALNVYIHLNSIFFSSLTLARIITSTLFISLIKQNDFSQRLNDIILETFSLCYNSRLALDRVYISKEYLFFLASKEVDFQNIINELLEILQNLSKSDLKDVYQVLSRIVPYFKLITEDDQAGQLVTDMSVDTVKMTVKFLKYLVNMLLKMHKYDQHLDHIANIIKDFFKVLKTCNNKAISADMQSMVANFWIQKKIWFTKLLHTYDSEITDSTHEEFLSDFTQTFKDFYCIFKKNTISMRIQKPNTLFALAQEVMQVISREKKELNRLNNQKVEYEAVKHELDEKITSLENARLELQYLSDRVTETKKLQSNIFDLQDKLKFYQQQDQTLQHTVQELQRQNTSLANELNDLKIQSEQNVNSQNTKRDLFIRRLESNLLDYYENILAKQKQSRYDTRWFRENQLENDILKPKTQQLQTIVSKHPILNYYVNKFVITN